MQTKTTKTAAAKTETKAPAKRQRKAPAKPATAAKPAPVAAAKPVQSAADKQAAREALAKRIAAERKTAADIFAQASDAVSVPVKTLAAFKRTYKRECSPHAIGRKPSVRQAAALAVAFAAAKTAIADGATAPRKFEMRGASYAIENGALSDCLASGLATYDSASETITIANADEIAAQIGAIGIKL